MTVLAHRKKNLLATRKNMSMNQEIVQGDYVIFVSPDYDKIMNYIVYQVTNIKIVHNKLAVELSKHNYINKEKEEEILKDLKEARYGEC